MVLGPLNSEMGLSFFTDEFLDNPITIKMEDVEITVENVEGWSSERLANVLVSVDFVITPALKQEGIAREFINRVQNLRKDSGFDVTDKISIKILKPENENAITNVIEDTNKNESLDNLTYNQLICREVQAVSLEIVSELTDGQEIEFEELTLMVKVAVV